jgi:hypothetical protein
MPQGSFTKAVGLRAGLNPTFAVEAGNCDFFNFFPPQRFKIATSVPKPCAVKTYPIASLSL